MQAPEEILKFFKIPKSEAGFIEKELLDTRTLNVSGSQINRLLNAKHLLLVLT